MLSSFRTALLAEGNSDRVLIPILSWLLSECLPKDIPYDEPIFIEPVLLSGTSKELSERIPRALEAQPCDLLFVHRDADANKQEHGKGIETRIKEITDAEATLISPHPIVCVIPVQETEAWLLIDEDAIWSVSGTSKRRVSLGLPKGKAIERRADPKSVLKQALQDTGCNDPGRAFYRLPSAIKNYSLLRQLSAFTVLEKELKAKLITYFDGTSRYRPT